MKKLLLLLVFASGLWGQTCSLQFTLTGVGNSNVFDNRGAGCTTWTVTYNSYGFSALSLVVQTAPNNAGVPGSWSTFTAVTGVNPNTATDENVSTFGGQTSYFPFLRVRLASATGTGQIQGKLYANVNTFSVVVNPTPPVTPGLPFNSVQYNCAGAFCGDARFIENWTALSIPAITVVSPQGTTGASTWSYRVRACNAIGCTDGGPAGSTATGNATLTGVNFNRLTVAAVTGATAYAWYRTAVATSPTTTGFIGATTLPTLDDTGIAGDGAFIPSDDSTIGIGGETPVHFGPPEYTLDQVLQDSAIFAQVFITATPANGAFHGLGIETSDIGRGITVNSSIGPGTSSTRAIVNNVYITGGTGQSSYLTQGTTFVSAATSVSVSGYQPSLVAGSASQIDEYFPFYAQTPVLNGGSTLTTSFGYYSKDLAGAATNPYYSWDDSQGVRRVREDNTFNAVGQAIEALYNPQFTKYTPGAADFERVILGQWNTNVAEIGTEKGGTGTLRRMRFIGQSVEIPPSTFAALATPGNANEVYCSDCTVTSGIDNTCAGTGSGAFAERINGAWKCFL